MSADNRGPHRHLNQLRLNAIGTAPFNPFKLDGAGETADGRYWDTVSGPRNSDGSVIPPDDPQIPWNGVAARAVRTSGKGKIFVREFVFDGGGALYAVSAEIAVSSVGRSMFERSGSGIQPRAAPLGESDPFYTATPGGLEARTDFEVGDETEHLRETDSGERVELKGGE